MVARWISRLAPFEFEVVYRPGVQYGHADGLSRRVLRACKQLDCKECMPIRTAENVRQLERIGMNPSESRREPIHSQDHEDEDLTMEALFVSHDERAVAQQDAFVYAIVSGKEGTECPWLAYDLKQVGQLQQEDEDIRTIMEMKAAYGVKPRYGDIAHMSPEVKNYWAQWGQLVFKGGLLYRTSKPGKRSLQGVRFVTPKGIRADFFKALHHGKLGGHQGVNKTLAQLKTRYYWPRMREDVQRWCARCHTCGETKAHDAEKEISVMSNTSGSSL